MCSVLSYLVFGTQWSAVCQAPLSMGFSRQESGVGSHSLLQGIFPNQGLNRGLLHCRQILYHLRHQGSLQNRLNDIKHVSLVYKYDVSNSYYLGSTLSEARILCLLQSAQLGLTVCSLMDYSLPDSPVHGIFQARILEQVAIFYSRGSSQTRSQTSFFCVSCIGR